MPVSKKGNLYYTEEQYRQARYNSSALEYAQAQGYELVRDGTYYRMKEHDSMIFTRRGNWFWNSRGISGGALEFMMYYENRTLPEAVLTLCGEAVPQREPIPQTRARDQPAGPPASPPDPKARQFVPPLKSDNFKRLFGYLCGTRGLEKSVVQDMIHQNVLYESVHSLPDGKEMHNACFLSYDSEGRPCGAFERGLSSDGKPYKREVPGSDKQNGWLFHGAKEPDAIAVFEAAIDAASYVSLFRYSIGDESGLGMDYLALGGLDDKPLFHYLENHPEIRTVWLYLDADEPGRAATRRILQKVTGRGYSAADGTSTNLPPGCKDWNDFLVQARQEAAQARQEPTAEAPEMEP